MREDLSAKNKTCERTKGRPDVGESAPGPATRKPDHGQSTVIQTLSKGNADLAKSKPDRTCQKRSRLAKSKPDLGANNKQDLGKSKADLAKIKPDLGAKN